MCASDVTATVDQALAASARPHTVAHQPDRVTQDQTASDHHDMSEIANTLGFQEAPCPDVGSSNLSVLAANTRSSNACIKGRKCSMRCSG